MRGVVRRMTAAIVAGWIGVVGVGVVVVFGAGAVGRAAESFTEEQRRRIDENAVWSARERVSLVKGAAAGVVGVAEWLIVQAPLPIEEQRRRADEAWRAVAAEVKPSEPSAELLAVFGRLVAVLPARMRPGDGAFELRVADGLSPRSRLVGDRRLLLDRAWAERLASDRRSGRDSVAMAMASELAHAGLGHAKRRLQKAWLEDQLRADAGRRAAEVERVLALAAGVGGGGAVGDSSYGVEEEYQADLFAIQLCRLAGFDTEACLDGLRAEATAADARLLDASPERSGTPPVELEIGRVAGGVERRVARSSPVHRLRRLRLELDGRFYGERWGLFEYDSRSKSFRKAADGSVDTPRSVVCVHGMGSSGEVFRRLVERLAGGERTRGVRLFVYEYPADESLARVGRGLKREMRRVLGESGEADFVGHSAGGLVFRHYAEVEGGRFGRAVLVGTPNRGSDLVRLRRLLEVAQFVGDLRLGYDEALREAIVDGRGQMALDLEPDSLFLTELNRPREGLHRERYEVHRGRVLSTAEALFAQAALSAGQVSLLRTLDSSDESAWGKVGRAAVELLELPAEVTDGDLCVTRSSAGLDGVGRASDHVLRHAALPKDATVVERIAEFLEVER